ncbi:phosphatidate cytidylyltransferase [Stappia sp. ES.058]|uniref:phosphatidate cytidylyltransferase n=1 Tax=Stappia sp. ES.058 TaxID=1881061 RepID=UPI00087BEB94|nr:phosphatidate cytidylyltransferase [Stappia sp. ES.058]SDU11599.1 phosphatidate cytidylyltransferase [Stappia sp. ES.058]
MSDGSPPASASASKRTELRLRVLSAVLLVPAALAVTYLGGLWFAIGAGVCALILLREWSLIVRAQHARVSCAVAYASVAAAAVAACAQQPATGFAILVAATAGLALFALARRQTQVLWLSAGIAYAGSSGAVLIALREGTTGLAMIMFLFGVVWATDIVAYFVGRQVGGPKLWVRVSPKKTWSGAIGGFAAAVAIGWLGYVLTGRAGGGVWVLFAAVLSVFSQIGDLFESALKRHFDVKDSGHIIPGHGGVMDRLDGLVGAGVLGYAVAVLLTGSMLDPVGRIIAMQGY